MKICAISDLHGDLPDIEKLKEGELLLIAGDIIPLQIQNNAVKSLEWWKTTFKEWIDLIKYEKVLFVAGNHDIYCESHEQMMRDLFPTSEKATYLLNENYVHISNEGKVYNIFGTPYCKIYGTWAFMRDQEFMYNEFVKMPKDVDILLSHDAPYGCSDILEQCNYYQRPKEHIGNKALAQVVTEKHPKIMLHGHLHSTSHYKEIMGNTEVYNVSVKDESYRTTYLPLFLEL